MFEPRPDLVKRNIRQFVQSSGSCPDTLNFSRNPVADWAMPGAIGLVCSRDF